MFSVKVVEIDKKWNTPVDFTQSAFANPNDLLASVSGNCSCLDSHQLIAKHVDVVNVFIRILFAHKIDYTEQYERFKTESMNMGTKSALIIGVAILLSVLLYCCTHRYSRLPSGFRLDTWTGQTF